MKKSELKPGMKVRHIVSGNTGEVYTLNCVNYCVSIRRRIGSGKNKGHYVYPFWNIQNLEIVSASLPN